MESGTKKNGFGYVCLCLYPFKKHGKNSPLSFGAEKQLGRFGFSCFDGWATNIVDELYKTIGAEGALDSLLFRIVGIMQFSMESGTFH